MHLLIFHWQLLQAFSSTTSTLHSTSQWHMLHGMSMSLITYVNQLFPSPALQFAKWYGKISMFLTNNSPDLYAITLCIMFMEKIAYFLARQPGISANSNENYRRYNFQAFTNISGNFLEIFRKFPEILAKAWKLWRL